MSIYYNHYLQHNRADDRDVNSSSVFPATDWLTSDQSLFIFCQASYHVPNVPVTSRLQTWHPPTNYRAPSALLPFKNLCPTESPIDCRRATCWCAVLPVPHRSNPDNDPIKGRRITDLSCRRWLDGITWECGRSVAGGWSESAEGARCNRWVNRQWPENLSEQMSDDEF